MKNHIRNLNIEHVAESPFLLSSNAIQSSCLFYFYLELDDYYRGYAVLKPSTTEYIALIKNIK